MEDSDANPTSLRLEKAVEKRLQSIDAGNYRRAVKAGLDSFLEWAEDERLFRVADVSNKDMVRWVEDPDGGLRGRIDADELSPRTAERYYAYVRATWTWWVKIGIADQNPAKNAEAEKELPTETSEPERQFWDEDTITHLVGHASRRVDAALDDGDDRGVLAAMRDRAVLLLLAYSGARGAELFRDPDDDQRDGVTWGDLDWDRGLIRVLGKTREPETALLSEPIRDPLQRYRQRLDPAEGWPVIPTLDRRWLSKTLREELGKRGWDDERIETTLDAHDPLTVCRREAVAPPGLSVRSARRVMRRLCDDADVSIDGEYLKPHGGRRGLGDRLYDEQAELAQEALRHKSVETTHNAYREERAEQTREEVDDVLADE